MPLERRVRSATRALSRHPRLLLVGIVALAAALRVLFLAQKSFWLDEAFSVLLAKEPWPEFARVLTEREANSGLYFLLLRLWLPLGDGEWTVRALSVLPAVATVPVLYALGGRLFGARTGLVAAFLLALNASHIRYAQEARGYSFAVFFVTLASLFFVRFVQRPAHRDWLGYVAAATLAIYSHFFAALVIAAHAVSLLWLPRREVPWKGLVAAGLAVGGSCLPLMLFALGSGDAGQIAWVKPPDAWNVLQVLWVLAGMGAEVTIYLVLACVALAAGLRTGGRGRSFQTWRYALPGVWLVLPLVLALVLSTVKPILVDRYLLVSLPAFVLLAAVGILGLPAGWRGRGAALAGVIVLAVCGIVLYQTAFRKEDWRGVSAYLVEHARPDDALLFYPPYVRRPFDYYAPKLAARSGARGTSRAASGAPPGGSEESPKAIPRVLFPADYSESLPDTAFVDGLASGHRRAWLVLSHIGHASRDEEVARWLDGELREQFAAPDTVLFKDIRVLLYGDRARARSGA
jgi:mannosyltransferase